MTPRITTSSTWIKSSYSGNGGQCIEWAPGTAAFTGAVPVRDSKNPDGPALAFPAAGWRAFVAALEPRVGES
ncbi:DUF397 domain-containing protein [Streptomyces sp. MP131-18]|uniref:DUF397 domain-containing protein n=1 Tax=Streptomyces sp. MP131-18 TaxID=1857892 RepID=UPI00097BB6D0|nr:DUF397 domain-containing protein [Streptomyces sp. MP131-18]ONK13787.1 hypothetical protein STBA_45600 [Streptomyces sp. MP131-18]